MTVARRDDGASRSPDPSLPEPGFSIEFVEPRQSIVLDMDGDTGTTVEVSDETGRLRLVALPRSGRQLVCVPLERPVIGSIQITLVSASAPFRFFQAEAVPPALY